MVFENQVFSEINVSQEEERPDSDGKESFKKLKDKSKLFLIFRVSENCARVVI